MSYIMIISSMQLTWKMGGTSLLEKAASSPAPTLVSPCSCGAVPPEVARAAGPVEGAPSWSTVGAATLGDASSAATPAVAGGLATAGGLLSMLSQHRGSRLRYPLRPHSHNES